MHSEVSVATCESLLESTTTSPSTKHSSMALTSGFSANMKTNAHDGIVHLVSWPGLLRPPGDSCCSLFIRSVEEDDDHADNDLAASCLLSSERVQ
uniref:Uncharacterized protein n=1 Tax=Mesocestoides corti TaxID=53468 RepID=A0A5K3FHP2_MESCO